MSDLRMFTDPEDEISHGLRAIYAAPAGYAYWNELEARIMSRVAEVELGWWDVLDRWARPAMVAAAVLMVGAGVTMYRANEGEKQRAWERISTPPPIPGLPVDAGMRPIDQDPKEKALRFLLDRDRQ